MRSGHISAATSSQLVAKKRPGVGPGRERVRRERPGAHPGQKDEPEEQNGHDEHYLDRFRRPVHEPNDQERRTEEADEEPEERLQDPPRAPRGVAIAGDPLDDSRPDEKQNALDRDHVCKQPEIDGHPEEIGPTPRQQGPDRRGDARCHEPRADLPVGTRREREIPNASHDEDRGRPHDEGRKGSGDREERPRRAAHRIGEPEAANQKDKRGDRAPNEHPHAGGILGPDVPLAGKQPAADPDRAEHEPAHRPRMEMDQQLPPR